MAARIPEEVSKKGMCMQDCSLAFCSTSLGSAVPFSVLSRHPIADLSFWMKTILNDTAPRGCVALLQYLEPIHVSMCLCDAMIWTIHHRQVAAHVACAWH